MAKKKKDPLAAAARQVVKDTTNKAVKQTARPNVKKQQPKQSSRQNVRQSVKDVSNIARNTMRNAGESTKKATVSTAKALPKKKAKPFKASDLSGNTGRGVTKQARKQTKSAYTGASQRKAQAKQKEKDIKAGKFNVPNRLGQADEMMLSQEGKNQVNYWKDQWEKAKARGDKAGMQKAHEEAEKVRLTNPATVKTTTYEGPTQSDATMVALQQYAQAMQAGDVEGMQQAKNLAAYAMLNLPKDKRDQNYMTGAYSGGTWGDRALEASESDILKNQGKNLLKSEGAAFASAVPEAAGGYIETVMNAPDMNGGSSQLVVKDQNVDKRTASQFDLRGQSRYTEEDARAKADHYQAQAEYLKQIARATTPLPGAAGEWAVNLTAAAGGMGIDLAANTIVPGSGLINMGARTWGSSVQQAKDFQKVNGTDKDPYADAKAYLYGTYIAATEIASEKMFGGPWSKIYGKGLLDTVVKGAAKPTIGKTILKGMMEEGTEEVGADIAQWKAPRIYGGETETLPEMLKGAAYDFTLGAALGGLGGAVTAPGQVRQQKLDNLKDRAKATGLSDEEVDSVFKNLTVGELELLTDATDGTLSDWIAGKQSGEGGNNALDQAAKETYGTGLSEKPVQLRLKAKQDRLDALGMRMKKLGLENSDITPVTTGFAKKKYDNELIRVTEMDDSEFMDWLSTQGVNSSQIENQSLTGASGEQSSEQTFEGRQGAVAEGKTWKALRKRLRESGVNDERMLRLIRSRMSAEEMEEAANLRKNDFLEWRDRVTSPDYQPEQREEEEPTENITAEELNEEEEDELSTISPAQINKLGDKLRELGVDSRAVARAISDDAVLEELVNMDAEELRNWAEEQKAPAKPSNEEVSEMLREQEEMLAERREREPKANAEPLTGDAALVNAMADYLGDAGRSTMISHYDPKNIKDASRYVLETRLAYNAGFTGNQISRTMNRVISPETANRMYEAGVMDKQAVHEQRRRKQARAKFYNSSEAGLGRDANGHYLDEYVENLARQSAENARLLEMIDRVGKAFGTKVLFPDAIEVRNKEGKATETAGGGYTQANIMLDKDLGKALEYTYGHELTHRMAEIDPKAYELFKKYVMSRPDSEKMYTELQYEYNRREIEADHDLLVEETCAEFSGAMISQADMLRDFARMADQNVVQRFFQALRDMARKLTGREKAYVERAVKVLDDAYRERYGVSMSAEMRRERTADVKAVGEMYESSLKQARKMASRPASSAKITKESDTRFSIKNPVEASGNLVALHNLTEDKLLKSIENGGFPMPSIAVTKADVEHSNFGDITLLMGRETVDPEADKRNRVYSADVWSPTFPQYEYEPDEKVEKRLRDKFYELSNKHGRDVAEPLYAYGVTLEDTLNRVGGYEGIISREKDNTNMKKTFLADKGRPIPDDVYKTKTNRIPEERINEANAFVENFGESNIEDAMSTRGSIPNLRKYFDENRDAIEDAFRRTWLQMSPNLSEQDASDAAKEVKMPNFRTMLLIIRRIQEGNIETQSQEYDPSASRKAVDDAVDQKEYEAWLEDLFKGVEKRRGIYNGKDFYTPSGNRRSFNQTHFEVTLENIVRAMKSQNEKNTAGFHGSKTVRAASAKSFKNVAQMHEDEGRLQNRTPEEAARLTEEMDSRLSDIINRIYGLKKRSSSDNPFIVFDSIGEIIQEVAETGRFTPSNVKNIFSSYEYDLPKDIADDIAQLINDIQEMPVNIFEAKPQRVVGLDEIVTAIIPDNASEKVVNALEENDIPIERYSSGDNSSRMSVVNKSADNAGVKFSLKSERREFNDTVVLEESTVDTYLRDYAAPSSPNYAQAYIVHMSPRQFLDLTTSITGRAAVERDATDLDLDQLANATRFQPFQIRINHETGEVYGHEGRHRMEALRRNNVYAVPVLLFDSSNKSSKEFMDSLTLTGQDFGSTRSLAMTTVHDLLPLSYANRDEIIKRFATQPTNERIAENHGKETVRYSLKRRDDDYMKAVNDGDMETAQRMVDEAAKEAGFDSPKLYHGTYAFGFTGIDTKKSNDRISFFATNSTKTAGTYSGTDSVRRIDTASDGGSTLGNYQLYANTDGMIELDAKGADSNHIELGEYAGEYNDYSSGKSYSMYATAKQIAKFAKKRGYSGVIIRNVIDTATPETRNEESVSDVYVFLKPKEQVKSADPVTYDDEGNIIPLSERFNPDNPDIRWALRGGRTVEELAAAYGIIPPGEKRAREVRVPQRTDDDNRVSRAIRTIMEAQTTPELLLPRIEEMIANGEFSYNPVTNKESVAKARATINELGYDEAWRKWSNDIDDRKASSDVVTLGWILYDDALKDGNVDKALEICAKMARFGSQLGQAVQAMSILKRLPTELQMRMIPQPRPKHVQDKIDEYEEEEDDDEFDPLAPDEYDEETGLPKPKKPRKPREKKKPTQEEVDQMEIDTAKYQIEHSKITLKDKWDAWRYLAMLANFRTHIRNIVGNLGFAPIVITKNLTATVSEIALYNTFGKSRGMQRTKGFYGLSQFHYAWNDFTEMRPIIMGEAKWEGQESKPDKVVFRGILAPIEKLRNFNGSVLDKEDALFSRPQYANALAQFMAANGITVEMMETGVGRIEKGPHKGEEFNGGIMQEARAYAVKEAQKATYRDLNNISKLFMQLGKVKDPKNRAERFTNILVEGIFPFRKTPANILCRSVEYSPAGFANGIWKLTWGVWNTCRIQEKVSRGEKLKDWEMEFKPVTVAEALDRLCSGLSGTGIFILGMYLAKMGLLVAKSDDGDDNQYYFDKLLGHQQWALEIFDYSVTIDWLAPEVVPLFMGAQYFTSMSSGNPIRNVSNMLDSATMILDPVMELSCLSGIQETLNNTAKFAEGDLNTMTSLIASMGLSYLTQGVPTLFGQLERVSQADRMQTFATENPDAMFSEDWQYQIGKISAKIPGRDYQQVPYIDSWGNTETETSMFKRIVANMFNPAYIKKIDTREVNKELQRLYDVTGDGYVFPKPVWKSYNFKDENGVAQTYYLTEEEWVATSRAKGRESFDLVQKFMNSKAYKEMSDPDRADMISDLYSYADYKASKTYIHNYRKELSSATKWIEKYETFSNAIGGYDVLDYKLLDRKVHDVTGVKLNASDSSKPYTTACAKLIAVYDSGAKIPSDPAKRDAMMEALDISPKVRNWTRDAAKAFNDKEWRKLGVEPPA